MYHVIEFRYRAQLDVEQSRRQRLERVLVQPGTLLCVQLRPHVLESPTGLLEVADLYLDDGSTIRGVPFACFTFVDCPK